MHLNLERANSSGCSAAPGPFTTCQRLKRRVSALAPVLQPCERCKPAAVNHRGWLMEGGGAGGGVGAPGARRAAFWSARLCG